LGGGSVFSQPGQGANSRVAVGAWVWDLQWARQCVLVTQHCTPARRSSAALPQDASALRSASVAMLQKLHVAALEQEEARCV
jgi:hypothetical protein